MLIRAIALSLALLFGIGAVVSLTTNDAEAGAHKHRKHRKHYKKYSKGWWRQYHRRMKRRREATARWRKARLRQLREAKAQTEGAAAENGQPSQAKSATPGSAPAVLPTGEAAPQNWKKGQNSAGEVQFRVDDNFGSQIGSAAISVVGPAAGEDNDAARVKTLGGVPTTSLRRTVIDKMIRENGWVVNDYQKDLGGKKVYVVVAQSQTGSGQVQSRMFYFTESDGRIYSVATNAPTGAADKLAEETEKVVNSLQKRPQQAGLR